MPVYVMEFVMKLIVICFENNLKSLLNVAKQIPGQCVSRHTISTSNFDPRFTAWCQSVGM